MPNLTNMSTIKSDLDKWLQNRPAWIRAAASCIIGSDEITDNKLVEFVELCKKEADGSSISLSDLNSLTLGSNDQGQLLRIEEISNVFGVNALAPRKPLSFRNRNLSVVYGGNGSGKSGYVRLLKHVCGARNAGELLGNVFQKEKTAPQCTLTASFDGKDQRIDWSNSSGICDLLSNVEVYDTSCGDVYLTRENELTYEPFLMSLLTRLACLCDKVSVRIDKEIAKHPSKKPSPPAEHSGTGYFDWYTKVDSRTSDQDIDKMCSWDEAQQKEIETLHHRSAQPDPAKKAESLRRTNSNVQALIDLINKLSDNYSDKNLSKIFGLKKSALRKRGIADKDASVVFEGSPLEGVGSSTWKALWEAAREYSTTAAYTDQPFPFVGDQARCVLCQSPIELDANAEKRLQSFESYVKGVLEREAKQAELGFKQTIDSLIPVPIEADIKRMLDAAVIEDLDLRKEVLSCTSSIEKRKNQIGTAGSLSDLVALPHLACLSTLSGLMKTYEERAVRFDEDAKGANRKKLEEKLRELRAKKWLSEQKTAVLEERNRLQMVGQLRKAKMLANPKSISNKQSSLASVIITPEYVKRFEDELVNLGASGIAVELNKTRVGKGRVYHQLQFKGVSKRIGTGQILSEGENRIKGGIRFPLVISQHSVINREHRRFCQLFDDNRWGL